MRLSIVIPAYNEEGRLSLSLKKIINYCEEHFQGDYEIIVVDDGSSDGTRDIAKEFNVRLTPKRENMGKGYSVKQGVLLAKGGHILYTDSDLSTPICELGKFMDLIKESEIVIASRAKRESDVKTRFYKKLFGRAGNLLISLVLVKGIRDTQCGFKLFRSDAAKRIFKRQRVAGWGFDFEVLFLAQKFGYSIHEEGIVWVEDEESKVKLRDYPKTLGELLGIRMNNFRGIYDED